MTTSLQILHQNLGDLKYTKHLENDRFKELYDVAKSYEKHANLCSLISRSKNEKLAQEINFYLILTKMLAELKTYEQHESDFSVKLEKVYKWYLTNKKPDPKEKEKLKQKLKSKPIDSSNLTVSQTPYAQVEKNLLSYRTELENENSQSGQTKHATRPSSSTIQLPKVPKSASRRNSPVKQRPVSNISKRKLIKETQSLDLKYEDDTSNGKLPELVNKSISSSGRDGYLNKLSPVSSSLESYQKFNKALEDVAHVKIETSKRMSEENRVSILKALSQYANKLYTSLDHGYTKKLESHLNSLTKFYHALDEEKNKTATAAGYYDMTKFFTVKDKTETIITGNALVDMAKKVSDKMILYKAETMIRQNEYKLSLEKTQDSTEITPKTTSRGEDIKCTNDAIDKMLLMTARTGDQKSEIQVPVYSLTIKNQKRPKSTPHMDWRGHVSRPGTVNTRSSSFKLMPTFKSRPKNTPQNLDDSESDFTDIEVEEELNREYEEFIREKTKSFRRKSIHGKKPKAVEPESKVNDAKEITFMNFVKKLEEKPKTSRNIHSANWENVKSGRILSTIKSQTDKISRVSTTKSRVSIANPEEMADRAESAMDTVSIEVRSNAALNNLDNEDLNNENQEKNTQKPQTATPSNSIVMVAKKSSECDEMQQQQNTVEYTQRNSMVDKSFGDSNDTDMKQIEMYRCLHNEIAECDCCKNNHPTTPITPNENDIFHLTGGGEEADEEGVSEFQRRRQKIEKQRSIDFEREEEELLPQHDLREILLANYDKKFAAKIGIPNFIPIEIISGQASSDGKPLEFIPFEDIDRSYPKVKGKPHFDPKFNEQPKILYRTNPSIPRPESRYGTRANVYEQILGLKQANMDSTALMVYEPEDVLLVRDLMNLQNRPLNDVLQCLPLRTDDELTELREREKHHINLNMTPMGRPVNAHPQVRWKQLEMLPTETVDHKEFYNDPESASEAAQATSRFNEASKYSFIAKEHSEAESVHTHKRNTNIQLKLRGSSYKKDEMGRPIPHEYVVESPLKTREAYEVYEEAKKAVHIPTLFKGSVIHNYVKELNLDERFKREKEQRAAIRIQQQYRQHIKNKKNIETSNPMTPEALNWIRNQKLELKKRKLEKENLLRMQEQALIKENLKLRNTLKHVGMHSDLFEILYHKGPEYTNGVLNEAATCIQRWVKGWLIRKEFDKLKKVIIADGTSWSAFIKNYRRTFKRILIMRGDHKTQFDFKTNEAVEFYKKEKKYLSYYQKLCFVDHLDQNDLEKMFHYNDLYPSAAELKEAKEQVLKYYKLKKSTLNYSKNVVFDIIYYIYPPLVTKLKSTRRSTWLNPIVGHDDALRLRGYKFIEETNYENSWQLVAQSTLNRFGSINKNTPEVLEMVNGLDTPRKQEK